MREAIAAGMYYERDGELLKDEIEAHYEGPRAPGALPLSRAEGKTLAIIAPNSPYKNCADCMAWSYKAIAESPTPDVYIIIATNQHSQETGLSVTTFNTPLGFARVDQELAKTVAAKGTIGVNEEIHSRDHVIEVQLPFLLHAKRQEIEKVKILPVLVSKGIDVKRLALDIQEALMDLKRKAIFIVSTDLTHYGPLFHYVPFSLDVQRNIYDMDRGAIEIIRKQDPDEFLAYVKDRVLNYHGTSAIELLLRLLPKCKVTLEQYYTSGDVLKDYKNAIAYAAIIFTRN
jgi:hypothetical protein